ISAADYAREVAPVMARSVPLSDLRELTSMLRGPGVQHYSQLMRVEGKPAAEAAKALSAVERAEVSRLDHAPASRRYLAAFKAVDQVSVGEKLASAVTAKAMSSFVAQARAASAKVRSSQGAMPEIPIEPTGLTYLDEMLKIAIAGESEMTQAFRHFETAVGAGGVMRWLQPEQIVTVSGRAQSRLALEQVEGAIETLMKEGDDSLSRRRERALTYVGTEGPWAELTDKAVGSAMEFLIRFGELQRTIVGDARHVLDYLDAHAGSADLGANHKLAMKTDEEHQALLKLLKQFDADGAELNKHVNAQLAQEEDKLSAARKQAAQAQSEAGAVAR
ncbi:MAG TPA: hypothetical protein VFF16_17995, partial [Telluria sp.]|nr:hypothetical protein [Telluria sp.]